MLVEQKCYSKLTNLNEIFHRRPHAMAMLAGSSEYSEIKGTVGFYQTGCGVLVVTEVMGLPNSKEQCKSSFFAVHIHEGESCSGSAEDSFANAMQHYNPQGCEHPGHAGDLPPLLGNQGYAFSVFLTDRFSVSEILGRTVIIHSGADDFHTKPSGNAGTKIACGVVRKVDKAVQS